MRDKEVPICLFKCDKFVLKVSSKNGELYCIGTVLDVRNLKVLSSIGKRFNFSRWRRPYDECFVQFGLQN